MKPVSNTANTDDLRLLSALEPGEAARIADIDSHDEIGRRLLDLGLTPETRISLVRRAPLGDPSVYELRGYQLCLRRSEADRIRIKNRGDVPGPAPASASTNS